MQDELIQGMYYVSGPFNNWQFKAMILQDGFYCTEVKIQNVSDTEFLVVRNKDFNQSFYPDGNANGRAEGPRHLSAVQGNFHVCLETSSGSSSNGQLLLMTTSLYPARKSLLSHSKTQQCLKASKEVNSAFDRN